MITPDKIQEYGFAVVLLFYVLTQSIAQSKRMKELEDRSYYSQKEFGELTHKVAEVLEKQTEVQKHQNEAMVTQSEAMKQLSELVRAVECSKIKQ
jgi:hypothetical protein